MTIDWRDSFVLVGVLCLGASIYMALGTIGLLGYAGSAMVVVGMTAAWQQKRQ